MKFRVIVFLALVVACRCEAQQPAAVAVPAKIPHITNTSVALSMLTAETYDQIYSSLNFHDTSKHGKMALLGTFGNTKTRTWYGTRLYRSQVKAYTFDAQYRNDAPKTYRYISAIGSITNTSPESKSYPSTTGYYTVSLGLGRKIAPNLEAEAGLGRAMVYNKNNVETKLAPTFALRLQRPISPVASVTSNTHITLPLGGDTLANSNLNVNYKLTKTIGLQFSYVTNNLLVPWTAKSGWDKTFRVLMTFNHSTTR